MNVLEQAIIFAVQAHSGACRKGSQEPYILHPLEAAAIAATMTDDPEVLAAAVLHDVVEDTPHTLEEIRQRFGQRVGDLVSAETWRIRKEETIEHLRRERRIEVKIIVMGDKLSNLRAMHRAYLRWGDRLWDRFNQKDAAAHAW